MPTRNTQLCVVCGQPAVTIDQHRDGYGELISLCSPHQYLLAATYIINGLSPRLDYNTINRVINENVVAAENAVAYYAGQYPNRELTLVAIPAYHNDNSKDNHGKE